MLPRVGLLLLFCLTAGLAQNSEDCPASRLVNVTVQSSAMPSLPGQTISFRVFVDAAQGGEMPGGMVEVLDNAESVGVFPLQFGQATFTRTFNTAGAHVLSAIYSGDPAYCSITGTLGQQVDHLTPTLTLSSTAATAAFGSPVTITAQIGPAPPTGVAAPAGPVQFFEGSRLLGSAVPASGRATVAIGNLAPGAHTIVAELTGDPVWYQVRSAAFVQTVGRASTTTVLSASAGVASTVLTAAVNTDPAGAAIPDGTVQFVDNDTGAVLGSAAAGAAARITIQAAQVMAAAGHGISAVYSGSANYAGSTSAEISIPVALNAAGSANATFAAEEIVSVYGKDLAALTLNGNTTPLPEAISGYSVSVKDSAGTERAAGLYAISPRQFNFVMPAGLAPGVATISLRGPSARPAAVPIQVNVDAVAPGLFTASGDGKGMPAAQVVRVRADGSQTVEALTADGIRIGGDTVYLVLYGTGIRNRSSLGAVSCTVAGTPATVVYAGAQSASPGLDQVNVLLPVSLAGKGEVTVVVTVDGQSTNTVTLRVAG